MADKAALRVLMRARRAGCDPGLGVRLTEHLLRKAAPPRDAVVAGFWPLPAEIDIRPLLLALVERGHVVGLPETPAPGGILAFHRWRPGQRLIPGRFATLHPERDPIDPDVVLVPTLAFDRRGGRLGYGGGYYDRTLETLAGRRTIGCAFAAQEVPCVPVEAHDRRLDVIATEEGVILPE